MDFIFDLPRTPIGNDGIWTIICRFSKQAHFVPVRKKIKSDHMVKLFMHNIFEYHGMPQSIVSDRDPRMTSLFWKALFENMGTTLKFSSSFHPQTDGQSKEANFTVLDLLKCYVSEHKATWEHYLPLVEYAYNNTVHTPTGKAPFEIVEGGKKVPSILQTKDKIFEVDKYVQNTDKAYRKIKLALEKTQSKQKKAADRHCRELVFSLGDWVLLRFEKARLRKMKGKERLFPKLGMRYYGPFQVCVKINNVAYRLKLPEGWKIHNAFHVSLLRLFVGDVPKDMVLEEQPEVEELDEILVPEQILARKGRKVRGKVARRYLVKFKNYSPMDAKWMEEPELVMITGDQALTACHVASQVHILCNKVLILTLKKESGVFEWLSLDEKEQLPFKDEEVPFLSCTHDLCITGDSIATLQRTGALQLVIPFVKVFARVSPDQKELILTTLKSVGRTTMMCGDGTNDVGALKQSHVGVALLNALPPELPSSESSSKQSSGSAVGKTLKVKKPKSGTGGPTGISGSLSNESSSNKAGVLNRPVKVGSSSINPQGNHQLTPTERQKVKLKKLMDEMGDEGDGRSAPVVRLGDASMASPFTAKHSSVQPTVDIIRQGRSTLVTTVQMFKILGLNCLATAYVLSVMYLDGVKLGDKQATISGVFTAAFFLFISHARPLTTLSAERPHTHIFCAYVLLSLIGQFAIHITFLVAMTKAAAEYMPEECIEPDSEFEPNLVNTVSYMANMMIQVATFAVNYMGHPFNQSIRENKAFFYALSFAAIFFTMITSDLFRGLNDWLRLVPLPQPFGHQLLISAFFMMISCYIWEHMLRKLFPGKMPDWKHRLRRTTNKDANSKKEE
ncbi:hypothetical protein L7F22_053436 [Adiantum nelumboides]|nr:hypothetical protein [Adiantum nelumboides]